MSEAAEALESSASAEQQAAAEKIGWIPPTRYKGDPDRYVDADSFLERGQVVLPILKKNNERLQQDLSRMQTEQAATNAALAKATRALEEIEERHSVATQKAVERAKLEVTAQLARASEAGDHEGVASLTGQLVKLEAAEAADAAAPPVQKAVAPWVPPPEQVEWTKENAWFGTDRRRTALALGIAQELREKGERATGTDFYNLVSVEVEKTLGGGKEKETVVDKVEGARGGGNEGGSRTGAKGGKSYASLPADAKAACEADSRNFVGAAKKYKSLAEWQSRYAELYFAE